MKILIASDSFKGTLTSMQACSAIAEGAILADANNECNIVSIADGGDGFLDAYCNAVDCIIETVKATGPYFERLDARIGFCKDVAIIESAEANGIIKTSRRDGQNATTYGVGELIKYALDKGSKKLIIGLGGSATSDCGIGALMALGAMFYDSKGNKIEPTLQGLCDLSDADLSGLDKRLKDTEICLACDVKNPLCGPNGAIYIYGAQKGVADFEKYEAYHQRFANLTKRSTRIDVADTQGCGAAGGLCAGLYAYCSAKIESGIECMLSVNGFDDLAKSADVIVGGEGCFDAQTECGKAITGIASYAKKYGKRMIVFAGRVKSSPTQDSGITDIFETSDKSLNMDEIKLRAYNDLMRTARDAFLSL